MSEVLRAGPHANPSAQHAAGLEARKLIGEAAEAVGALVGLSAGEVVFTSGATESIGLGVIGAARYRSGHGRHVITGLNEHPAGLNSCLALKREGFEVTCLESDSQGVGHGGCLEVGAAGRHGAGVADAREQRDRCRSGCCRIREALYGAWRLAACRRGAGRRQDFAQYAAAANRSAVAHGAQVVRTQGRGGAVHQSPTCTAH